MDRQQHEFLYRKINLDNKTSSAKGSIVSPIPVHNHEVVASPFVFDDHCKWGKPHTTIQTSKRDYVLALRHYHVTLMEFRPDLSAPPWTLTSRFMELGPITEAPPWTSLRRAHEIMSIRWGTTTSPVTRVMELCPTKTLLIHYQPIVKFLCIPLTCPLVWMINHQLYLTPSSLPIHLFSPITYIVHEYPPLYT